MQERGSLGDLTLPELEALRGAAVWYAKYRAADIGERTGDRSASAVVEREEYLALVSGLRKLGVRLRVPDALMEMAKAA